MLLPSWHSQLTGAQGTNIFSCGLKPKDPRPTQVSILPILPVFMGKNVVSLQPRLKLWNHFDLTTQKKFHFIQSQKTLCEMPNLFLLFSFGREIKNLIIIHPSLHSAVAGFHYLTGLPNSCSPLTAPSSLCLITNYFTCTKTLSWAGCRLTELLDYFLCPLFQALHLFQSPEWNKMLNSLPALLTGQLLAWGRREGCTQLHSWAAPWGRQSVKRQDLFKMIY